MKQNIIIKGTPRKNQAAIFILIVGIVIAIASFIVAWYTFNNGSTSYYHNYKYIGLYDYEFIYCGNFMSFYKSEFFSDCIYGYMLILGIIVTIAGIIIKLNTEKCEITVTNEAIFGKLSRGKEVLIPINQITNINRSLFNGISIASIGNVSNFRCIENRDEVMKAIAYLLANPQQRNAQPAQTGTSSVENGSEAEQLKQLKDLLDAGILTQEEFDAKKRQILGL